jgi:hypothetical protein
MPEGAVEDGGFTESCGVLPPCDVAPPEAPEGVPGEAGRGEGAEDVFDEWTPPPHAVSTQQTSSPARFTFSVEANPVRLDELIPA